MARKMKNIENDTQTTVWPGIWLEKLENIEMSNAHPRTCIMARKLKIMENEKQTM